MRIALWSLALCSLASAHALPAEAQEKKVTDPGPWQFGATVGVNLSQSTFSSNWAGGDKGSVAWVLNSEVSAERQFNRVFNFSNQLQLAYGQTARQIENPSRPGDRIWDKPDKTTDLVALETTGRFSLQAYVDPFFSLRLDSQFSDESSPIGNIAWNPIKLRETAGIARVLDKTEDSEAISRLGFGFRQTIARSFVDPATARTESFVSNDGGFEWKTTVKRPLLAERVLYKGTLVVFQPVFYSKARALESFDEAALAADPARERVADFWRATDVSFQNSFSAQVTKLLSVNLFVQWVYDKFDAAANVDNKLPLPVLTAEIDRNVRKAGQFKETMALGLSYRLF